MPEATFAILARIFSLASEGRPLNLSDYRAFWDHPKEDAGIALTIIEDALKTRLARPLDIDDRRFLDHCRLCAHYLAEQGHQGIDDDRDHWHEDVTGDWQEKPP